MGYAFNLEPKNIWVSVIANSVGIALQVLAIYLVIKWSREHNRQFENAM